VLHAPNRTLVSQLAEASEALLRVVSFEVENVDFRFKGGRDQFVHVDVCAVKLQTTNAILQVGVPAETVGLKIEQLHIAVVITGSQASLFLVVPISESNGPAVGLNWLALTWLE